MSVIFEPETDAVIDAPIDIPTPDEIDGVPLGIVSSMKHFLSVVKAEDLAGIAVFTEKTQYKHDHKAMKKKGGHPPIDYLAVETLVDCQLHCNNGEYREALPFYFFLRRLTTGGSTRN